MLDDQHGFEHLASLKSGTMNIPMKLIRPFVLLRIQGDCFGSSPENSSFLNSAQKESSEAVTTPAFQFLDHLSRAADEETYMLEMLVLRLGNHTSSQKLVPVCLAQTLQSDGTEMIGKKYGGWPGGDSLTLTSAVLSLRDSD
jgi:hypothetical protein